MPSFAARAVATVIRALKMKQREFDPARFAGPRARPRKPNAHRPPRFIGRGVTVAGSTVEGWPVYTVTPADGTGDAFLYLHGGAYANTILVPHWLFLAKLAKATGRTITVPVYPLTPEHNHQEVFPTLLTIYRSLVGAGAGAGSVAVGGDSAGAGMALALAQSLPDDVRQPDDLVLFCPWLDVSLSNPDIAAVDPHDPMLNPEHLRVIGRWWAGPAGTDDPLVSPINGPVDRLGRITVFSGTRDILHPDVLRWRDRNGDKVVVHGYDGLVHDWMLFPVPETGDVIRRVGRLLRA